MYPRYANQRVRFDPTRDPIIFRGCTHGFYAKLKITIIYIPVRSTQFHFHEYVTYVFPYPVLAHLIELTDWVKSVVLFEVPYESARSVHAATAAW